MAHRMKIFGPGGMFLAIISLGAAAAEQSRLEYLDLGFRPAFLSAAFREGGSNIAIVGAGSGWIARVEINAATAPVAKEFRRVAPRARSTSFGCWQAGPGEPRGDTYLAQTPAMERELPLPDRVLSTCGGPVSTAYLATPTDRYDHGVLGDDLEAGALIVRRAGEEKLEIFRLPQSLIFEDRMARIVARQVPYRVARQGVCDSTSAKDAGRHSMPRPAPLCRVCTARTSGFPSEPVLLMG